MKKFLIPTLFVIASLIFVGCASKESEKTFLALNNQLARVENVVSSTNVNEVEEVSPYITLDSNQPYNSIQSFRAISNEKMLREEELRQEVLSLNTHLQAQIKSPYKLTGKKNNALKSITSDISKYTTNLNGTKAPVKNNVISIKKSLNVNNMDIDKAISEYTKLNNNMNERYAYLQNIYSNLQQACTILECPTFDENKENICDNDICDENTETENLNKEETETNQDTISKGSFKKVKNIDTYATNNQQDLNSPTIESQGIVNNQPIYYPNNNFYRSQMHNPNYFFGNRANPNRNTDTFYSFNKNIDTYRFPPYNYNFNYYNY